ncbi:Glucan 1,3-beta-glucosidase 3 [Coemansia sp. RSA 353]|nr:Glucan 1,3-beta-glucosidase 3 [Coemansia sp. RSA 551]KAJ2189822.1 Glucan 1,3-beta-glucosidase 3 [Coemansia sp. RSA 532]KAJ2206112.1 Glucan 1,3-beta-glucosidase 3 [Coemansia sp. RSA 521]KAJ2222667.1 Glucan 1,3-beta-glucosidase 3 [Coemansia sp. RSA 518]KAJ2287613.1 Glucan 1,3-beta-glucosidase 3 [Coemansia sp. RSA 355]KAJ2295793.1 Glucan 1,3-beta-glucosidase 3 [Coemansia sp. RSA 353]KAJ2447025.1 Glucan 1,3-beta-glucosidase 3 [Coemansia sp. RSA 2440]
MNVLSSIKNKFMRVPPDYEQLSARLGTFAPFDAARARIFRYRKQYGVNLGSMFCLEPWIATIIYDEYAEHNPEAEGDLVECMGQCSAEKMQAHWDTWLQRADFEHMASMGINAVRLPVGYWILGHGFAAEKYHSHAKTYNRALYYVGRIIAWADEFDIGVLVDIHALPGGQNNDSHSGATGPARLFESRKHQDLAIKCIDAFAYLLAQVTNIVGLQIINEPQDHPELEAFYERALKQVRVQSLTLPVYVGDAWNLDKYTGIVKGLRSRFGFVVLDTHKYWVFRPEDKQYPVEQLIKELRETDMPELLHASDELEGNLVIGEYSSILPAISCQGTDPTVSMREFSREQLHMYNSTTAGTFYWTWRLQHDAGFWSMQFAINEGAMPSEYFPFGWNLSVEPSHEVIVNEAEKRRSEWREKRLQGHMNYVSQWEGDFGFDHYAAGFDKGLTVALEFFSKLKFPSKLGFIRQFASECAISYVSQHGGSQWQWEYVDGFREANDEFSDFVSYIIHVKVQQ